MSFCRRVGLGFTLGLGLIEPAGAADAPVLVPGTSWIIDPGEGWEPDQIGSLAALVSRLPDGLRDPGGRVHIALEDAPPLGQDAGHTLGRAARLGRRVTIRARGLEERLGESPLMAKLGGEPQSMHEAALALLDRVVVHELTHLLDGSEHLSREASWRALSGWRFWSAPVNTWSGVASGDFASPWGRVSPSEDLATFAEVYFVPPPLGPLDADDAPRCRFPTKYAWFAAHLGPHPDPTPNVRCSGPEHAQLSPEQVGAIDVIFATPTLAKVASVSGHLLLAVEIHDGPSTRWDVFSLVADAGPDPVGLDLVLMGLTGMYPSKVDRRPYETTRLRYVEAENRDILRYRFELSDAEKVLLLTRLDDMVQHWHRPYLFLQQNCSALIIELANTVEEVPVPSPFVVAPDMVLAELIRRGRIRPVAPDPARDLSPATRAQLLAPEVLLAGAEACGGPVPGARSERPEARGGMYQDLIIKAKEDPRCWSALAELLAISEPLDEVIVARDAQTIAGREAALEVVRAQIPTEDRVRMRAEVDGAVSRAWVESSPEGRAAQSTPYGPWTLGVSMDQLGDGAWTPLLSVRRAAIELVHGQPRLLPPARGLDLRALDSTIAVEPAADPALLIQLKLLRYGHLIEPLLPHPAPLWRLDVLDTELSTARARLDARWIGASGGLTLVQDRRGWDALDLAMGLGAMTRFTRAEDRISSESWLLTPLTAHGVLHTDGRVSTGLEGSVSGVGALSVGAAPALGLEGSARGWIGLGRWGQSTPALTLGAEGGWGLVGAPPLPDRAVSVGLTFERR